MKLHFRSAVRLLTTGSLLAFSAGAFANLTVTPTTDEVTLATALLAPGTGGITNLTVALTAHTTNAAASSGTYQLTDPIPSTYGLRTDGIVLSTGNVADYSTGPNTTNANNTSYGVAATVAQQALLGPISGVSSNFDATTLELTFDVNAGVSNLWVSFVFGSEEFPEGVLAEKDGFGIYLNGVNVAKLGGAVITSRHTAMTVVPGTELDGVLSTNGTRVIKVTFPVASGSTSNTLTFIIGDSADDLTDSTVFLTGLGYDGSRGDPNSQIDLNGEWTSVTTKCKTKKGVTKCSIKGRLLVHNDGSLRARKSRVQFYLSEDALWDAADKPVKKVSTGTIKAGKAKKKTASVKTKTSVSGLYLIAVIDATEVIHETDEDNNVVIYGPFE